MKVFLVLALSTTLASAGVIDPNDSLDEDEFREKFHLPEITDPEEKKAHEEALKEAEAEEAEVNAAFLAHNATWFDEINELSDVPSWEMGDYTGRTMATGRLETLPENRYDPESERYFDQFRYSRAAIPDSYNAVKLGLVTPVKSQGKCGSCVAFATAVNVEACHKKATGVSADYSEQKLVDCAYDYQGAEGCNGAPTSSYTSWLADKKVRLASEAQYPYKGKRGVCPANPPSLEKGVKITGSYFTKAGTEDLLKKMVYEHGAVVSCVAATGPWERYGKGIFAGCNEEHRKKIDHCIAVVGYGSEGGNDYWLVKNSWGDWWGEKGYIRMKRGNYQCGIGQEIALVTCASSDGKPPAPTPAPTKPPCKDDWEDCDWWAQNGFCDIFGEECKKSCKKC